MKNTMPASMANGLIAIWIFEGGGLRHSFARPDFRKAINNFFEGMTD